MTLSLAPLVLLVFLLLFLCYTSNPTARIKAKALLF
jgi:hypothetical protein